MFRRMSFGRVNWTGTPAAQPQASPAATETESLRPILDVIAALLMALLIVSTFTLVVRLKTTKAATRD